MDTNANDANTNGYQETGRKNREYAQNAKARTGTSPVKNQRNTYKNKSRVRKLTRLSGADGVKMRTFLVTMTFNVLRFRENRDTTILNLIKIVNFY